MIAEIQIENFKSIAKLSLKPGSVTVLIGENGSGKSNILEAIAFAAAASADKLDDEFLYLRGIRVTEKEWMRSAFVSPAQSNGDGTLASTLASARRKQIPPPISICVFGEDRTRPLAMKIKRASKRLKPSSTDHWRVSFEVEDDEIEQELLSDEFPQELEKYQKMMSDILPADKVEKFARRWLAQTKAAQRKRKQAPEIAAQLTLKDYLIYAPENSVLRNFDTEGAIKPLGTKGEGLLKLLQTTASLGNGKFAKELKSNLELLGWFGDLQFPTDADEIQGRLRIRDRWLSTDGPLFDQRSANEGFLYLLFYFTLFLSNQTPAFFAIDNIDNSLNPKLCSELIRKIAVLAEKSGKQVICTTHNPAVLNGLNLHNDQQRLYVVRRNSEGHTVVNRVNAPRPRPDGESISLSAAFMSGMLGGLPEHF